jgi:sarcosine oxidase subunit gamma
MVEQENWSISSVHISVVEVQDANLFWLRIHRAEAIGNGFPGSLSDILSKEPNKARGVDPRALWLAPNEWLISSGSADSSLLSFEPALSTALHHVSDVTDGHVVFDIGGDGARDLLANGCSLDLHHDVFGPNDCARSLLTNIPILIECREAPWHFRLYADISYGWYLRAWFEENSKLISEHSDAVSGRDSVASL